MVLTIVKWALTLARREFARIEERIEDMAVAKAALAEHVGALTSLVDQLNAKVAQLESDMDLTDVDAQVQSAIQRAQSALTPPAEG